MGSVKWLLRECFSSLWRGSLGWKSHVCNIASTLWCCYKDERDLGPGLGDLGFICHSQPPDCGIWECTSWSPGGMLVPSKTRLVATPGAWLLRPSFSRSSAFVKHSWGCWLEYSTNSTRARVMHHLAPEILGRKFSKLEHFEVLWIQ